MSKKIMHVEKLIETESGLEILRRMKFEEAIAQIILTLNPRVPAEQHEHLAPLPHLEKIGGMDEDVKMFISGYCDISSNDTHVAHTSFFENIDRLKANYSSIVNLKRVNDLKHINKFFAAVNNKLPKDGVFISCVETKGLRRQRIFKKFPPVLNTIYYTLDFILKRVFPKLPVTRNIYWWLTKGRNRVLSRTETLGRLYAAGFELIDKKQIGNNLYFTVRKSKQPLFDYEPVYGPVFKLRRQGKNGAEIFVYKMRTMHAYSEFIQQYLYENNSLAEGGKLKDDFRISTIGKFLRKYWVDELPMIINFLKGDLKIVGVRPLSSHYLSLYSDEVKSRRAGTKPGLIPPYYADMPKNIDEIMASEMKYLDEYEKRPFRTDLKYFLLCLNNILFKQVRSS